jgi:hypothetical protein
MTTETRQVGIIMSMGKQLTSRPLDVAMPVPFCIGTRGIPRIRRLFGGLRPGCSRAPRFDGVAERTTCESEVGVREGDVTSAARSVIWILAACGGISSTSSACSSMAFGEGETTSTAGREGGAAVAARILVELNVRRARIRMSMGIR